MNHISSILIIPTLAMIIFTSSSCGNSSGNPGVQEKRASIAKSKERENKSKPNIVFILSDDQSWTDYGFMGHPNIETPNIDKLASEGLTFTRGYVTAPLCSPSLASIITGLYPHQHGVTGNDPEFSFEGQQYREEWLQERALLNNGIIQNFKTHPTIPALLKEQGYISLQTGKWWEGSWRDGGFTDGMTHGDPKRGGRHGDEGLNIGREGMQPIFDFIDKAQNEDKPFFLWYAPFMPHTPHTPPDSLLEKYMEKTQSEPLARYWAMIEWFDITIGQLLGSIDERGLAENTLVVYVTDNGWIQDPERMNKYMPRSKRSPYDMGIRTPIIYKWPGHIAPRMDTTTFVSSIDMVPTALKAVGLEPTPEMQGINVMNREKLNRRSAVFSEDFAHDIADINHPTKSLQHRMIMKKTWKLIIPNGTNSPEKEIHLYNILEDPLERNNIASGHPEVVKELRQQLNEWWEPVQ